MDIPTIKRQLSASQKLFEALDDGNDNLDAIHLIEHHFLSPDKNRLAEVKDFGEYLGFGVSDLKEGTDKERKTYFHFDLLSRTSILGDGFSVFIPPQREAIIMLAIAEATGTEYDGWGTKLIPKGQS
jgi:regulator of RNase E activity RraB